MYKKVNSDLNFVEREDATVKFWEDHGIFEKSVKKREGGPMYMFYDGPPTANGKPHIGHVETRAIKDIIPRYRAMKGYEVPRKAGWDTHGLPVELEVEKEIGIEGGNLAKMGGLMREASDMQRVAKEAQPAMPKDGGDPASDGGGGNRSGSGKKS